jgi:hypothetical protein
MSGGAMGRSLAILILFADDSTMLIRGRTIQEANINTVRVNNEFVEFSKDNLLTSNANKTKVMQMHTHTKLKLWSLQNSS